MTDSNEPEIDEEKYEREIRALRRINERVKAARNWLMNTSLASLAFFLTMLTQIRSDTSVPLYWLGISTFLLLACSVLLASWLKFRFELESNFSDLKDSAPLFKEVLRIVKDSENETEETKQVMISTIGKTVEALEGFSNTDQKFEPLAELKRLIPAVVALAFGLIALLLYLGLYYFS